MFEFQILFGNVLLPSAIAVGVFFLARYASQFCAPDDPESGMHLRAFAGALAGTAAISGAFWYRNELAIVDVEPWRRIPLACMIVAVAAATPAKFAVGWIVRGFAVIIAAKIAFPTGEGWESLQERQLTWLLVTLVGTLPAWWLLAQRPPRDASWLALSWIACTIAGAVLTAQSFMRVTEPMLAVASVLGCISLLSFWLRSQTLLAAAVGPCLISYTLIISHAQFESYLGLSDRLSFLALLSPTVASLLTQPLASQRMGLDGSMKSQRKLAYGATLGTCVIMAAIVIVWTLVAADFGAEEW